MKEIDPSKYQDLRIALLDLKEEIVKQTSLSLRSASLIGQLLDQFARLMTKSSYVLTEDFNNFYTKFLDHDLTIRLAVSQLLSKSTEFNSKVKSLIRR